jgi:hypothetical protein
MLRRALFSQCAPALRCRGFATVIPPFHLAIPVRDLDEGIERSLQVDP